MPSLPHRCWPEAAVERRCLMVVTSFAQRLMVALIPHQLLITLMRDDVISHRTAHSQAHMPGLRVDAPRMPRQIALRVLLPAIPITALCCARPGVYSRARGHAGIAERAARQSSASTRRILARSHCSDGHQFIQPRARLLAARTISSCRIFFKHGPHTFTGLFFALPVIGLRKRWLPNPPSHIFDSSRCAPGLTVSLCSALNAEPPPELP
jgi:hypothetical protein